MMNENGDCDTLPGDVRNRQTLLKHFDISIEEMDYKYVATCSDGRKLEKILRILRSGEEGCFPDLETFVAQKLQSVEPLNIIFRKEAPPILRPESLDSSERKQIESDLLQWIDSTSQTITSTDANDVYPNAIFESPTTIQTNVVPIRLASVFVNTPATCIGQRNNIEIPFLKRRNPNHIKSWEYDKWDKFDVDTELIKLEVEDMKAEESNRIRCFKTSTTVTDTDQSDSLTVNKEMSFDRSSHCSLKSIRESSATVVDAAIKSNRISTLPNCLTRSFIEEIPTEELPEPSEGKRRVKIMIDDVNIAVL